MKKQNNTLNIIIILVILLVVGYFWWSMHNASAPALITSTTPTTSTTPNASEDNIVYTNDQYGFNFTLPLDWKGYTIVDETWSGTSVNSSGASSANAKKQGPEIIIRNPKWTDANKYQDIPIMIFTPDQWKDILSENLAVSAAPIPPSELGHNANYVFALPPRYNYAYPTGWEEVDKIMQDNPLQAF